jgi:hypothetical protein
LRETLGRKLSKRGEVFDVLSMKISQFRKYRNMNDVTKYIHIKTSLINFAGYMMDFKKYGLFSITSDSLSTEITRIHLNDEWRALISDLGDEGRVCDYVPLRERESFFEKAKDIEREEFYCKATRVAEVNFKMLYSQNLLHRLEFFRRRNLVSNKSSEKMKSDYNVSEDLFIRMKELLLDNDNVSLEMFEGEDIREEVKLLIKNKIANFVKKGMYLEATENYKKKMCHKLCDTFFPLELLRTAEVEEAEGENSKYFRRYFDLVYYILITEGSMEEDALLKKIGVMERFELWRFMKIYEKVFSYVLVDGVWVASLKEEDEMRVDFQDGWGEDCE